MLSISDEVDIIVTDSPIILPHFYEKDIVAKELLKQLELYYFNKMNNLNVYLIRDHEYKTEGRFQTEQQAEVIHELILDFLIEYHIDYISYHTSKIESDEFLQYIKNHIEKGE